MEAECPRGPGGVEGRKHRELLSSRTRIPHYRTANTTRAHDKPTHTLIRYTAG